MIRTLTIALATLPLVMTTACGNRRGRGGGAFDTGSPRTDSGSPTGDSGSPTGDSGSPTTDSGSPTTDSGSPTGDSGSPGWDSSPPAWDSGRVDPCLGVSCSSLDDQCNAGTCDPVTGSCLAVPAHEGMACSDGSTCTTADVCRSGVCTGMGGAAGDTCATPITISGAPGLHTATGDASCATASFTGSCGGGTGRDVVYTFSLAAPASVRIETTAAAYDTLIYLRSSCTGSTNLSCNDDGGVGTLSRISTTLGAGTYFIVVDAFGSSTAGTFTLDLDVTGTAPTPTGHAVLIGHDYFNSNTDIDRVLGNAVFLANTTGTVNILGYTQYSDNATGGEAAHTRTAVRARATALGRSVVFTALSDYTTLAGALPGKDVLLVYEQESSTTTQMTTVANAWNAQINSFLAAGGVVIVLQHVDTGYKILHGTGLMTIGTRRSVSSSSTLTVRTSTGDPTIAGLGATYRAASGTTAWSSITGATVTVTDSAGNAVVAHLTR